MLSNRNAFKFVLGIVVSLAFLYLAVRQVDVDQMLAALAKTDYRWILLSASVLMLAHLLRSIRWRYFLLPIQDVNISALLSALLVGYAANTFMPAHLGEFLRAFVIARKKNLSASSAFASIVVERIVDIVSLIVVMGIVLLVHPFPAWVETSGIIMLIGALLLLAALAACKRYESAAVGLIRFLSRPLPARFAGRIESLSSNFLNGIVPLKSAGHYAVAGVLSAGIWLCYAAMNYACLEAFNLASSHRLPWYIGLVVLVFTTFSVVIPSTPGYVGTYHYLCQVSLVMFGVSASAALSFAVIAHLVNIVPVSLIGLACANYEGVAIFRKPDHQRL
jgi:glycosyltransferase 2 family protein